MDPQVWRKFFAHANVTNQDQLDEAMLGSWLISMITTHIDDIKGSATDEEQEFLLNALQKDYGSDAKIEKTNFEHAGSQHEQDLKKGTVYTHQNHYVKDLSEIPIAKLEMSDLDK